jgi:hypothetical protein
MPQAFIHIGANKTGSTTLQRWLFAKSTDLVYLGEDCAGYENYRDTLNSLVSDDDLHFVYEEAREIFRGFMVSRGEKTFLYSNEDIMTSRVPTQCAQRLHEFLPDAEILVIVRNQLTAIPSFYANHGAYLKMVPRRYWRRYVSFDEWMDYCTEFIKYSPLDSYFYYRILNLYASLFGKQRIHILLYEDFVNDKEGFIHDLCGILRIQEPEALRLLRGKRERRRNTKREFRYHRFRSWFLRGKSFSYHLPFGAAFTRVWYDFLERGAPADGFMSDYWRNKIIELYKEDNTKFAKEYHLRLKEYAYPVA